MDSMRGLSSSLPRSSPNRHRRPNNQSRHHYSRTTPQPSTELLQAFKNAALSVTQLYKTATENDSSEARKAGYQDAIDELLHFLDDENIGLEEGQGWRVRQWATERLSPERGGYGSEADAEGEDSVSMEQGENPVQTKESSDETEQPPVTVAAEQTLNMHDESSASACPVAGNTQRPEIFTFRSATQSPSIAGDLDLGNAVRINVTPRGSRRQEHRRQRLQAKSETFSSLGQENVGTKRKSPFSDFFDLGNLEKESRLPSGGTTGGWKRGRFS